MISNYSYSFDNKSVEISSDNYSLDESCGTQCNHLDTSYHNIRQHKPEGCEQHNLFGSTNLNEHQSVLLSTTTVGNTFFIDMSTVPRPDCIGAECETIMSNGSSNGMCELNSIHLDDLNHCDKSTMSIDSDCSMFLHQPLYKVPIVTRLSMRCRLLHKLKKVRKMFRYKNKKIQ